MADFDPTKPSIARIYDYLLNGKDNFAADREVARRLLDVAPLSVAVIRENRQFLTQAVTWAATAGISQFIDLGCGMPTAPNTHQTARAVTAGARVAYVDNDPVVLSHLRALTAHGDPAVTVVDGDVREADKILGAVGAGIDLTAPACLLVGFLLHFFEPGDARDLMARYVPSLAPGSCVVLSAGRADAATIEASRFMSCHVTPNAANGQPRRSAGYSMPRASWTMGSSSVPRMRQSSSGSRIFSAPRIDLKSRPAPTAGGSLPSARPLAAEIRMCRIRLMALSVEPSCSWVRS